MLTCQLGHVVPGLWRRSIGQPKLPNYQLRLFKFNLVFHCPMRINSFADGTISTSTSMSELDVEWDDPECDSKEDRHTASGNILSRLLRKLFLLFFPLFATRIGPSKIVPVSWEAMLRPFIGLCFHISSCQWLQNKVSQLRNLCSFRIMLIAHRIVS